MTDRPFAPDRRDPPRARDGNVAIREEFDAAIAARSADALSLFIARHPRHPLAAEAETARRALIDRR
jgi:hypothetical protein